MDWWRGLDDLPLPDAVSAVASWVKSAEFLAFVADEGTGAHPIAILPPELQAALAASTRVVLLSRPTVLKQRKHPEIRAAAYSLVQEILSEGEGYADRDRHIVAAKLIGQWYVAVVKATGDRRELYLQSFRRSDEKNVARIRARSNPLR